jgi:signal peptidase
MSLLLVDEPAVSVVPLPRSWEGEGRPRWRPEPPAATTADLPKRKTAAHRLGDLLLTLAALVGVVVMGITVTAHSTGLRPLVVKSGSMEPTIPTGGMILVRTIPASEIEVDDVVAVKRPDNTRVTHRVLEVVHRGATAELTLRGDANEDPDPIPVTVTEAGELVMSVPSIGRVSAFFASAKGGFVLGCIFTAVALPVLRRRTRTT